MDALKPRAPLFPPNSFIAQAWRYLERHNLVRFLYNHNPFYVIGASLVFWGLRSSFDVGRSAFNAGALTICLAAFTLLLAATAILIIRWGKVWEDARSLLLLIVLMFLGISVTFDNVLANNAPLAKWYYLAGLAFSIAVSETVLRALPLRLAALFRVPFYLLLALFYLYPLTMSGRLDHASDPVLQWQLFGFSSVAAVIYLTLLPAVRRGRRYSNKNGSPWRWPLFPWVLFGMLGFCVCLRAYYLCMSLHYVGYANTIFGLYFLAPMLLAVAALLVESGISAGSQTATKLGLALPVGMLLTTMLGRPFDPVYGEFLTMFQQALGGTPLFIGLLATILFYAVATARRVRSAADLLSMAIAALAVVGPQSLDFGSLTTLHAWPLALAAGLHLWLGVWRWDSRRLLVAACGLVAAASLQFSGTWFTAHGGAISWHLILAAMLVIGATFDDRLARRLRSLAAFLICAFAAISMIHRTTWLAHLPTAIVVAYPVFMASLALAYGYLVASRGFYTSAMATVAAWLATYSVQGYLEARQHVVGLDQLCLGAFFFGCATLISLAKAGVLQRWIAEARSRWQNAAQPN